MITIQKTDFSVDGLNTTLAVFCMAVVCRLRLIFFTRFNRMKSRDQHLLIQVSIENGVKKNKIYPKFSYQLKVFRAWT